MKFFKGNIEKFSNPTDVFVFGSNASGRHGAGAALTALRLFGAEPCIGEGLTGNAYALPTLGHRLERLNMTALRESVRLFIGCVKTHPSKTFWLTPVGTGIAGFAVEDIAELFKSARNLPNLVFPEVFLYHLDPLDTQIKTEVFP